MKVEQKMADRSWQKVREIFDSAVRRKTEERRDYIIKTCGEDKTLQRRLESLLDFPLSQTTKATDELHKAEFLRAISEMVATGKSNRF